MHIMKQIIEDMKAETNKPMRHTMVNLKHGDRVIINGKRGHVGTVGGYAVQYNENPLAKITRAKELHHELSWVIQEAACLCGDPGYYDWQQQYWADAIPLHDGQLVWLDGQLLITRYLGDYSDMVKFEEIKPD